jgi:hypothetical protein
MKVARETSARFSYANTDFVVSENENLAGGTYFGSVEVDGIEYCVFGVSKQKS